MQALLQFFFSAFESRNKAKNDYVRLQKGIL